MIENAIVFALSSSVELAQEIVEYLGLPMGKISVKHFADGEIMVEPEETVRGRSVYIVQSTCSPVSDRLMEVLIAIDACKRASAGEITVIMPDMRVRTARPAHGSRLQRSWLRICFRQPVPTVLLRLICMLRRFRVSSIFQLMI